MMRLLAVMCLVAASAGAKEVAQTEKSMEFEVKLGPMKPLVDRQFMDLDEASRPYQKSFNGAPMIFGEIELDKQLWQSFGTLGVGLSIGYGEKFGKAVDAITLVAADESTGLRVVPIKALAVYRWDWAAIKHNIPLVPYLKAGVVLEPWWVVKGQGTEVADGLSGTGVKWGVAGVLGMSFLLDFLDPRLARDFDSSAGVNHTYLFAEYSVEEMTLFQGGTSGTSVARPLDLSSRHWMFGLSIEF